MPTTLTVRTRNQVSLATDVAYSTNPGEFIAMVLADDYLIWTAGDATVIDHFTGSVPPTSTELNAAATIIDEDADTDIALCLLMDDSCNVQGSYWTHKVLGMGENKRYVFCFSFDGATATKPRLEAWDTDAHLTAVKNVLGLGTATDSFVHAVKTTDALPGGSWAGTPIAGAANYVELDSAALSGAKDLYANIKITIPDSYATPAAETFCLTIRFTYL